ncbi:anti-sigma factor family protein [Geodermatophilus ruber]|uniref:Putative zinc-finger n=1 Tax=Geodermatophilus ruber TaxID=504800 RepID=A0A1I4KFC7_9ACTN|nr:zf-HC2 domain-containing protein [Geodermatophilus ruber]SFL77137.1 Putative zinc-finger [Geodermatophilus ruber]
MRCPQVTDLGGYVLDGLEPDGRRRVEEHLRGCAACRQELAELSGLPRLLALVDPADLRSAPVAPSPDLFDRVAAATGPPPRRARLLPAAAAVVLAVGGAAAGVAVWPEGSEATTVTASSGPVELTVTLSGRGDGTELDVDVAGLAEGAECRLVVVDASGRRHPAGEWAVDAAGGGTWTGWTAVDPGAVSDVLLLGGEGQELLRIAL